MNFTSVQLQNQYKFIGRRLQAGAVGNKKCRVHILAWSFSCSSCACVASLWELQDLLTFSTQIKVQIIEFKKTSRESQESQDLYSSKSNNGFKDLSLSCTTALPHLPLKQKFKVPLFLPKGRFSLQQSPHTYHKSFKTSAKIGKGEKVLTGPE